MQFSSTSFILSCLLILQGLSLGGENDDNISHQSLELTVDEETGRKFAKVDLVTVLTESVSKFRFRLLGTTFDPKFPFVVRPDCGCADVKIVEANEDYLDLSLALTAGSMEQYGSRTIDLKTGECDFVRVTLLYKQVYGLLVTPSSSLIEEGTSHLDVQVKSSLGQTEIDFSTVQFEGNWISDVSKTGEDSYRLSIALPSGKYPFAEIAKCRAIMKDHSGRKSKVHCEFAMYRKRPFACVNRELQFAELGGNFKARAWLSGLGDGESFELKVTVDGKTKAEANAMKFKGSRASKGYGFVEIEVPKSFFLESRGKLLLQIEDNSTSVPYSLK